MLLSYRECCIHAVFEFLITCLLLLLVSCHISMDRSEGFVWASFGPRATTLNGWSYSEQTNNYNDNNDFNIK